MGQITIKYPNDLLESLKETEEEFANELKVAASVTLYEIGKLSSGKAAQLAGMNKMSFLKTLGEYHVSISTIKEFEEDMKVAVH